MQVAGQLQALLAEKARLASENARLAHENTSLQVKTCHLPPKAIHAQQEIFSNSSSLWQRWKEDYSIPFRSVLLNVESLKALLATILRSIRGLMCLSTAKGMHHLQRESSLLQELLEYTVRSVDSAPTDRSEDGCSNMGGENEWEEDGACADEYARPAQACAAFAEIGRTEHGVAVLSGAVQSTAAAVHL